MKIKILLIALSLVLFTGSNLLARNHHRNHHRNYYNNYRHSRYCSPHIHHYYPMYVAPPPVYIYPNYYSYPIVEQRVMIIEEPRPIVVRRVAPIVIMVY